VRQKKSAQNGQSLTKSWPKAVIPVSNSFTERRPMHKTSRQNSPIFSYSPSVVAEKRDKLPWKNDF